MCCAFLMLVLLGTTCLRRILVDFPASTLASSL